MKVLVVRPTLNLAELKRTEFVIKLITDPPTWWDRLQRVRLHKVEVPRASVGTQCQAPSSDGELLVKPSCWIKMFLK